MEKKTKEELPLKESTVEKVPTSGSV